jgi:DNA segregation ATPase FtsK/SpoIIIE-like protein
MAGANGQGHGHSLGACNTKAVGGSYHGLIKANVPTRILSRFLLRLIRARLLILRELKNCLGWEICFSCRQKSSKLSRVQGPYVSEKEVKKVADFIADQKRPLKISVEPITEFAGRP